VKNNVSRSVAITERQFMGSSLGSFEPTIGETNSALTERVLTVTKENDLSSVEAMVLAQAHTCEAIFHEFARRAHCSDTVPKLESYMRLALKAQQQSASTLRILGELKAPKQIAFIRQANLAHGSQQVNNGTATPVPHAHARETNEAVTNEVLTDEREAQRAPTLDTGATKRAGREDTALASVAVVNRTGDGRG
jgi:hypothetical protein